MKSPISLPTRDEVENREKLHEGWRNYVEGTTWDWIVTLTESPNYGGVSLKSIAKLPHLLLREYLGFRTFFIEEMSPGGMQHLHGMVWTPVLALESELRYFLKGLGFRGRHALDIARYDSRRDWIGYELKEQNLDWRQNPRQPHYDRDGIQTRLWSTVPVRNLVDETWASPW